jgi:hypothetical protein
VQIIQHDNSNDQQHSIYHFYFGIMPSAIIKRLFGGAPMPVKPDRDASSYWVNRTEPVQTKERFLKR